MIDVKSIHQHRNDVNNLRDAERHVYLVEAKLRDIKKRLRTAQTSEALILVQMESGTNHKNRKSVDSANAIVQKRQREIKEIYRCYAMAKATLKRFSQKHRAGIKRALHGAWIREKDIADTKYPRIIAYWVAIYKFRGQKASILRQGNEEELSEVEKCINANLASSSFKWRQIYEAQKDFLDPGLHMKPRPDSFRHTVDFLAVFWCLFLRLLCCLFWDILWTGNNVRMVAELWYCYVHSVHFCRSNYNICKGSLAT